MLYPFNKGEYWGMIDAAGNLVIEPTHSHISNMEDGYAIITDRSGKSQWFIDGSGHQHQVGLHSRIGAISENLFSFSNSDLYGFKTIAGDVVVKELYPEVMHYACGAAAVKKRNSWDYIDTSGKFITDRNYVRATAHRENMARIEIETTDGILVGFVDKRGREVISPSYEIQSSYGFSNGVASVKTKAGFTIIDVSGRPMLASPLPFIGRFSEGIAIYQSEEDSLFGLLNSSGSMLVAPSYEEITDYRERHALAKRDDGYFIIDTKGAKIGHIEADTVYPPSNGRIRFARNDEYQFCTLAGAELESETYRWACDFNGELAYVETDEWSGYINAQGVAVFKISR